MTDKPHEDAGGERKIGGRTREDVTALLLRLRGADRTPLREEVRLGKEIDDWLSAAFDRREEREKGEAGALAKTWMDNNAGCFSDQIEDFSEVEADLAATIASALATAQRRIEEALKIANDAVSGRKYTDLSDAVRQLAQAVISERDNAETAEQRIPKLEEALEHVWQCSMQEHYAELDMRCKGCIAARAALSQPPSTVKVDPHEVVRQTTAYICQWLRTQTGRGYEFLLDAADVIWTGEHLPENHPLRFDLRGAPPATGEGIGHEFDPTCRMPGPCKACAVDGCHRLRCGQPASSHKGVK